MTLSSGQTVQHYRIVEKIGEGGMGEVYRAHDERLDRDVAIKVLLEAVAQDTDRLARFEREAKAVARLDHPNILAIHEFGTDQGVTFAVTELLEGESLRECLINAGGPLAWRRVQEIGAAVANGLGAAHSKGVVHRDLKPENIFLVDDGRVKILDFGLAQVKVPVEEEAETATLTPAGTVPGTVMGTVGYMSPEQVRGQPADARSDIFALGCVLYEMLAGHRAFKRDTSAEIMTAILREEPPSLAASGVEVRPEVEKTVERCLEKNPERRFQSARDLAFALGSLTGSSAPGGSGFDSDDDYLAPANPEIPEEPSIAVLPFANMSSDPEQEYFSDGLTEDIITDLSLIPGLFVIARNSTFTYKGKVVTTQQVGKEMGVRYVLEGSVRKSGKQMRITGQLLEAASGRHLWAKRYDRTLEDVFALQDELTKEIVTALDVELVSGERGRHQRSRFKNPEAGEALYRGMANVYIFDEPSHALAKTYFEEFTRMEPESVVGYVWHALLCQREVFVGWGEDRESSLKSMGVLLERALKIDARDPLALGYAGMHQLFLGNHDQAIAYAKQALAEGPGMDSPYYSLGWIQIFDESPLEGIENLKRSMRLSPSVTGPRSTILGTAYRNAGQLELAVSTLENTVKRFPAFVYGRVALASSYILMGKEREAKQEVVEILQRDPAYTIARYTSPNLYRNKETMEKWAETLRKAGIPE